MITRLSVVGTMTVLAGPALGNLQYTFQELRDPTASIGGESGGYAVNDSGTVAGGARGGDGHIMARLWKKDGTTYRLPVLPLMTFSVAYGLNQKGDACGWTEGPLGRAAMAWFQDQPQYIGFPPDYRDSTYANAINSHGDIVISAYGWPGHSAFVWENGTWTLLSQLDSNVVGGSAFSVNDSGTVCGDSTVGSNGGIHAVRWDKGSVSDLGDLLGGTDGSIGFGMNQRGDVVGVGTPDIDYVPVAWFVGQPIRNLGGPPGWTSEQGEARGVNDLRQVCGITVFAPFVNSSPFIWTEATGFIDLSALCGGMPGWVAARADSVNNKGSVCGSGMFYYQLNTFRYSAFRLDPVTTLVPASSFTVVFGQKTAGNVASLASADGDALRVCRFIVPNQSVDPVQVRMEATLPWQPMNLWFKLRAKAAMVGSYTVSLNLYDWTTSLYDPASNVTTPLSTSYSESETIAKGDISRYVRASDKKVWALVRVRPTGPVSSSAWCADFDQAVWEAVPLP
ncbi:MAG: hypothetical protein JSS66_09800 [Armatimonadetes bacterium]|nr:hypothetical protein [Armatimonadota bacterium]